MTGKRSLRQRIIHAGLWTIGGHASSQILRLISNLLTTRLLVPEAFGIMALANTFVLGLALFSDVGLGQSVVRSKRSEDPAFTNTVWTLQALRGCLIWSLCLGLAFAVYALAQGALTATGIDASAALVQMAAEYSGAPCEVARIESISYEDRFDGIWACASLLHLPRDAFRPNGGSGRLAEAYGSTVRQVIVRRG